jgi:hypothetical protein
MLDLRYGPQWRPAYAGTPGSPALAQAQPQQPPIQVVYQDTPFDKLMGSPGVALATDVALALVGGYTAYELSNLEKPTGWSTVWWVIATAAVIKGFHDYKRISA